MMRKARLAIRKVNVGLDRDKKVRRPIEIPSLPINASPARTR